MKKVSIIKGFFVILLSIMLIGATNVFAVDVDEEEDIDTVIMDEDDVNSTPAKEKTTISTPENNTTVNNTATTNNTAVNNTATNNTSASVYNNTVNTPNSLSKAGLEDSLPTMVLIVVFGISAIYAYKKIRDYKNI